MKIKFFLYCLLSLFASVGVAKEIKKTNPISYFELRSLYCKEKKIAAAFPVGTPCKINSKNTNLSNISDLNIAIACQNYYNENHCSEVSESDGISKESLIMSCLPKDICNDETDLNLKCLIDGASVQFEISNLAITAGMAFGISLTGATASATGLIMLPFIILEEGKKAEACNSDIKYKKMMVKMHNLNLSENEKSLDIDGVDKNVLKMQCRDLNDFLRRRLEILAEKKLENSRWSMTPIKDQISPARRAYLENLHSHRCYSSSIIHKNLCESFAGFVVGSAIASTAGIAGNYSRTLLNRAATESGSILQNLPGDEKSYINHKNTIESNSKLSANENKLNLKGLDNAKNLLQRIEKDYCDLLKNSKGNAGEITSVIALLEAKGVSREVIRKKIQEASKKHNDCKAP